MLGLDERASRKAKETVAYRRAQRRLGDRVRELRAERELTLEQLAERADLDLKHLQKIEAGTLNPTLVTFVRLAKGLRVDLGEVFKPPGVRASPPRAPAPKRPARPGQRGQG
jgi:transcriptional regulator with XRE-family HTH domain